MPVVWLIIHNERVKDISPTTVQFDFQHSYVYDELNSQKDQRVKREAWLLSGKRTGLWC